MKQIFRVYLKNYASINTACGYGEGETIKEAQENALRYCMESYGVEGRLEGDGWEVGFRKNTSW